MNLNMNQSCQNLFKRAYALSKAYQVNYVGSEHFLLAFTTGVSPKIQAALAGIGLTESVVKNKLDAVHGRTFNESIYKETLATLDHMQDPLHPMMQILTPKTRQMLLRTVLVIKNQMTKGEPRQAMTPVDIMIVLLDDGDNLACKILSQSGQSMTQIKEALMLAMVPESYHYMDAASRDFVAQQQTGHPFTADLFGQDDDETEDVAAPSAVGHHSSQKTPGNVATPKLDQFGIDLTEKAKTDGFDPIIGRSAEITRAMEILCRRNKNNPVLIGEPGVGKTAIAEGLATKIVEHQVPDLLADKRIISLDIGSMLAGAKYRGEFEERIKGCLDEAKQAGNVILFIDEVHTVVGAGDSQDGSLDAANMLKPMMARGDLQIIGATTIKEYRQYIEKDAALERRFQPVKVDEPSADETLLILKGLKNKYEDHHHIEITDEAIEAAVKLSIRYINDRYLPDKAIDLIDEGAAKLRLKQPSQLKEIESLQTTLASIRADKQAKVEQEDFEEAAALKEVEERLVKEIEQAKSNESSHNETHVQLTADDVAEVVAVWTGVPVQKITETDVDRLRQLDTDIKARVIGQDEAVDAVTKAIRRGRLGLKDPNRPTGSFIFMGTTGVGKTEIAKALAEVMFGKPESMIRLDMSEYVEGHSVSRMIGSPPGYVGHDESGQLTEHVRRFPYSVVLFDEIEKAHPNVLNLLLQILDDGRLTDGQGRTVDFKNTIVIMTSNVGAHLITGKKGQSFGFGFGDTTNGESIDQDLYGGRSYDEAKKLMLDELKQVFRPEFINRVDDIIFFHMLNRTALRQIVTLLLKDFAKRAREIGITLMTTRSANDWIAEHGYDPEFGARPLRREIQSVIEDRLSEALLTGAATEGDTLVIVKKSDQIQLVLLGDYKEKEDLIELLDSSQSIVPSNLDGMPKTVSNDEAQKLSKSSSDVADDSMKSADNVASKGDASISSGSEDEPTDVTEMN